LGPDTFKIQKMGDTGSGAFGLVYHCSEAAFVRMRGESEKLNGSKCNRLNLIETSV
jgi:hypothetical protein